MASYTKVQDVINTVTAAILEPWDSGASPGPSLGIVSMADLLVLFSLTLEDFVNRTGLNYSIFSQQVNFNQSSYQLPENLNEVKVAFVNGQHIDHLALDDLDAWQYNWRSKLDVPTYWHSDGLPPKTIELAANPNYNGAGYVAPLDPNAQPPYGIYGLFNGATPGQTQVSGMTVSGTTGTWVSGNLFDLNWNNYYPGLTIVLDLVNPFQIASVTSPTVMTFATPPGDGVHFWQVNVKPDLNLTIVGSTGLSSITYSLSSLVPVIPDSAAFYISYGILARLFSGESELKDSQRAYYCLARYNEGIAALSAISGEISALG